MKIIKEGEDKRPVKEAEREGEGRESWKEYSRIESEGTQ